MLATRSEVCVSTELAYRWTPGNSLSSGRRKEKGKGRWRKEGVALLSDSARPDSAEWQIKCQLTKAHTDSNFTGSFLHTGGPSPTPPHAGTTQHSGTSLIWFAFRRLMSLVDLTNYSTLLHYENINFGFSPVPCRWPYSYNATCQDLTSSAHKHDTWLMGSEVNPVCLSQVSLFLLILEGSGKLMVLPERREVHKCHVPRPSGSLLVSLICGFSCSHLPRALLSLSLFLFLSLTFSLSHKHTRTKKNHFQSSVTAPVYLDNSGILSNFNL